MVLPWKGRVGVGVEQERERGGTWYRGGISMEVWSVAVGLIVEHGRCSR